VKTEKIVVADLFEKPRRYLIPIFQRGYVWTRDSQWAPLWNDVLQQVAAIRAAQGSGSRIARKHFLGAIVLQQETLGVKHVPVSDVIDGQQRLITLQILLLAFRDAVSDLGNTFVTATLARLTQNPGPYLDDNERYKVWPTSVFQEDFRAVAAAGSAADVENLFPLRKQRRKVISRPQLAEAYLYFYERIATFLGSDGQGDTGDGETVPEPNERAEELLDALSRHVQLVEINLDTEDDPQIIFETLNARGAPLSPADLIRNFLFLYATRRQENVVQLYDDYWKRFDEEPDVSRKSKTRRFWREEERQGRLRVNRLDLFFFHYLGYRTASELMLAHIFPAFKDWWESHGEPRNTSYELAQLNDAASTFKALLVPTGSSGFAQFAERLRALDTSTVYPLVLFLAEYRSTMGDADFEGCLLDLESYLVRRAVCGLTAKNYNRVFLSLIRQLQTDPPPSRVSLQRHLLALEGESSVWPTDTEFERGFISVPAYEQLKRARVEMILRAIEDALTTSKQEFVTLGGSLSIEHIWPQSPRHDEWPDPPKKDDGTLDYEAWFSRQRLLESFGNLTLVTPSFNSSLSNAAFSVKRPLIIRESRLRLNCYFQDLSESTPWDEEAIRRRSSHLYSLAHRIWPRPV
jgi:hypothetical protein